MTSKIVVIPGSLRSNSSSNAILNCVIRMFPRGVSVETYQGIGTLPHFDDPADTPETVRYFRNKVREADAVLICTPEYAFGIPGSLKNALDWTVGTGEFVDKPVGFITASSQGEKGHAALLLTLTALSSKIIDGGNLLIPSVRSRLDVHGNIKDLGLTKELKGVVDALVKSIQT